MDLYLFDQFEDVTHLGAWLEKRGIPKIENILDELPTWGYIAFKDKAPIACAFLRTCEGGHAMIDGLTSNPDAPSQDRHQAIDALVEKLHQKAKELNVKNLYFFSLDTGTLERAQRHGYVKLPHTLMGLDLSSRG